MLRFPPLAAGLLAAALTGVGADAGVSYFPFVKEVRMPAAAARSGQGAEIPLDAEFFDAVEHPARECRIFTVSGAEVPFAEARRRGTVRRTRAIPLEADLAPTGADSGEIRIPGGLAAPVSLRMEFEPEAQYFAKFLRITAKLPSGETRTVLDRAGVYSFAAPTVRRTTVDFYAPGGAELTLQWLPGGDIPQKILRQDDTIPESWSEAVLEHVRIRLFRVEMYRETAELPVRYRPEIRVEHKGDETIVSFASRRVPLNGVRLTTRTPFLIRPVRVYGGSGPEDLRLIAEGAFMRLRPFAPLFVAIPESRCRYYELRLENRGEAPLDDIVLEPEGPQIVLQTVPPEESSLKLVFGRLTTIAEPPERLPGIRAYCTVGKRRKNPEYEPPVIDWAPETWYTVIGGILLVLGGGAAVFAFRRSRGKGAVVG